MFIDYDALQDAFLLVCEKPLLVKLINSCFFVLPICVCAHISCLMPTLQAMLEISWGGGLPDC